MGKRSTSITHLSLLEAVRYQRVVHPELLLDLRQPRVDLCDFVHARLLPSLGRHEPFVKAGPLFPYDQLQQLDLENG